MLELITGRFGYPHVTSADAGALMAHLMGSDTFVMHIGEQFKHTKISDRRINVAGGNIYMQGRHGRSEQSQNIDFLAGIPGMNKTCLVVARYEHSILHDEESMVLKVIEGVPQTGTPRDPAYVTGDILAGDLINEYPMFRVKFTGSTMSSVVPLFTVAKTTRGLMKRNALVRTEYLNGKVNFYDSEDAMERSIAVDDSPGIFYSSCGLSATTSEKVIGFERTDFTMKQGVTIGIKFVNGSSLEQFTIKTTDVNGTYVKPAVYNGGKFRTNFIRSGEIHFFQYDGSSWNWFATSMILRAIDVFDIVNSQPEQIIRLEYNATNKEKLDIVIQDATKSKKGVALLGSPGGAQEWNQLLEQVSGIPTNEERFATTLSVKTAGTGYTAGTKLYATNPTPPAVHTFFVGNITEVGANGAITKIDGFPISTFVSSAELLPDSYNAIVCTATTGTVKATFTATSERIANNVWRAFKDNSVEKIFGPTVADKNKAISWKEVLDTIVVSKPENTWEVPSVRSVWLYGQAIIDSLPDILRVPISIDLESNVPAESTLRPVDIGMYYFVQNMDVTAASHTGKVWVGWKDPKNESLGVMYYRVYDKYQHPDNVSIMMDSKNQLSVSKQWLDSNTTKGVPIVEATYDATTKIATAVCDDLPTPLPLGSVFVLKPFVGGWHNVQLALNGRLLHIRVKSFDGNGIDSGTNCYFSLESSMLILFENTNYFSVVGQCSINLTNSVSGTLQASNGGTGFREYLPGDILAASSSTALMKVPIGTPGQVLTVEAGRPAWKDATGGGGGGGGGISADAITMQWLDENLRW